MIEVRPSVLSADFARLGEQVRAVEEAGAAGLHVDVMDGHFVPNLTLGVPIVESLARVARTPLDVHVMITDPLKFAPSFVRAGAATYTFHVEAPDYPAGVSRVVRQAGARVGIALNPDTPVERVAPYLELVDLVLVMSVFPGFGGQRFLAATMEKVRRLRRDYRFAGDIEVDGGIDADTVVEAARAGANVFVAGSAVFGAPDPAEAVRTLLERARGATGGA